MQTGMFLEDDPVHNGEMLLSKLESIISKARVAGVQVVYVQHNEEIGQPLEPGTPNWTIHPRIAPMESDLIIQKQTPDSFHHTTLQDELESREIKKLFLTGIQTDVCVDTTCRRAYSLGYDVTLIKDAHSTWNAHNLSATQIIEHHNGLLRWFASVIDSKEIEF